MQVLIWLTKQVILLVILVSGAMDINAGNICVESTPYSFPYLNILIIKASHKKPGIAFNFLTFQNILCMDLSFKYILKYPLSVTFTGLVDKAFSYFHDICKCFPGSSECRLYTVTRYSFYAYIQKASLCFVSSYCNFIYKLKHFSRSLFSWLWKLGHFAVCVSEEKEDCFLYQRQESREAS